MKRTIATCAGLLLASAACGLTEGEASGLLDPTSVNCPTRPLLNFEEAAARAQLVVHARPMESFFVDNCHRAFLLEVESVWQGKLPDPVLAIVRTEPSGFVERWTDLGLGETAVFLLESDPEVPEAFRPVGEGGVVPITDGFARICQPRQTFGCDVESIALHTLQGIFHDNAADWLDHVEPEDTILDDDPLEVISELDVDEGIEISEEPSAELAADEIDLHSPEARIDFAEPELIEGSFHGFED